MDKIVLGNISSNIVLIQPIDDFDLKNLNSEYELIKENTNVDFILIAIKVKNRNSDLSPWGAPAGIVNERFDGYADNFLKEITRISSDKNKTYIIGGYSLAALFSLWASYKNDSFIGVAAASPSIRFPSFIDFMKENQTNAKCIYLSLGDKEDRSKNKTLSTVKEKIIEAHNILKSQNIEVSLEWNEGNHFKDPHIRTAKAFTKIINNLKRN